MYQEKIAKWQTQVEERLRVLGQRSGEALHSSFFPFSSVFLVNLVTDSGNIRNHQNICIPYL
jgi:spastin